MAGGAPTRVRSSIADRAFLVDVFVNLFEVRAMEAAIRTDLAEREPVAGPTTSTTSTRRPSRARTFASTSSAGSNW